jgi:hypothetical protein
MNLAYIGIAVVVALVLLTVVWGLLRPTDGRQEPGKRYEGFRQARDESDSP